VGNNVIKAEKSIKYGPHEYSKKSKFEEIQENSEDSEEEKHSRIEKKAFTIGYREEEDPVADYTMTQGDLSSRKSPNVTAAVI